MLKSYRLKTLKKKKKKKRRNGLISGAVGAVIGIAFLSQTANVLRRL